MSVNIPSHVDFDLNLDVDLSGVPSDFTVNTNLAPLTLNLGPSTSSRSKSSRSTSRCA